MHRYRIISLLAVILLMLSMASLYAARSSRQFQLRGTTIDFPQPVEGADSLRIGVNASLEQYAETTLNARLSDLASRGVRYARQEFRWTDMEPVRGQIDWSVSDRIFSATRRYNIQVLPVLLTTPQWARTDTGSSQSSAIETTPPHDPQDFAAFAGAFARRYDTQTQAGDTPSVLAYQIWDEPNLSAQWGNGLISPIGYLRLLRAARTAIRSVNPEGRIILAGLAPTVEQTDVNLQPNLYLRKLYEAGGRDAFDVVATKPYGFDNPPDDRRVNSDLLNFSHTILMREEMVAHGDAQKAIWLTQWGWNAQLPGWQGQDSMWSGVSETEQAQYTAHAIQRVAHEWYWAGAMFLYTLQPNTPATDARWGFALLDQQANARPVYDAFTQAIADAGYAPRAQWATAGYVEQVMPVAITSTQTSAPISYRPNPLATFSEGWRFGELGADIPQRADAGVTIHFSGDALAMIVRRDDYRAYMFISVDGKGANLLPVEARGSYLILTSPDRLPRVDTIAVADHLGAGNHVAEIKIDRGWNQWALVGWSSRSALGTSVAVADIAVPTAIAILCLAVLGLVVSVPRAHWREVLRSTIRRAHWLSWQALAAALVLWLTSSLTWAEDVATAYHNLGTPAHVVLTGFVSGVAFWSPIFVISLIALALLFILVMLRLDLGLALLAFFIPFYLVPQHIFAKAFPMVEILLFISVVSWMVRKIRREAWRLGIGDSARALNLQSLISNCQLLDWSILGLVVVATVSASQADFKVEALRELRMVIVEPAILFLLLRTVKLDAAQIWRIADGFVLGAVAIAFIGLANYVRGNVFPADFGFPRIRSVYGSANNDALYLGRAFPLLLAAVLFGRWVRPMGGRDSSGARSVLQTPVVQFVFSRRVLYAAGLVLVAIALFLSASRGALLLGLPLAMIAVCVVGGGRWRHLGVGLFVLGAVALIGLLSGVADPFLAGTRFANALDLTSGTGFFRMNLWESALVMWRDHPVLGVGPDNFLYAYRGFYILPAAWQEPNLSHPHNIVLDFATRLGTLGLLVGSGLVVGIVRTARRALARVRSAALAKELRPLAIGLIGLFVDMVAHGMVDNGFFLVDLAFVFMLACGLLLQIATYDVTPAQTLTKL